MMLLMPAVLLISSWYYCQTNTSATKCPQYAKQQLVLTYLKQAVTLEHKAINQIKPGAKCESPQFIRPCEEKMHLNENPGDTKLCSPARA